MKVSVKIELKDYIKLMFFLAYRKTVIRVATFVGVISVVFAVFTGGLSNLPSVFFGLIILVALPLSVYWQAVRNYKSSPVIRQKIEYEFSGERIKISGESFHSEIGWDKIYKVEESKDWFLLYHNNLTANILPKINFVDTDIEKFKTILKQIPGLQLRLRK